MAEETLQGLDERIYELQDKCVKIALILEDVLVTLSRVLEREELFTYDEYADVREALSELRDAIEELRAE